MTKRVLLLLPLLFGGINTFAQEPEEESLNLENTVLYGDYLEMKSGDELSEFHMKGNVSAISKDFELSSDELYIVALKKGDADATVTEMGKITKLTATGNVKIKQEGRTAEAGHAEFMPEEETMVLTINPVVTDEGGTVSGERITWSHGDRRAQVEGGEENRVVVTLGVPIPDTGYDPNAPGDEGTAVNANEDAPEETQATEQEPDNNPQ